MKLFFAAATVLALFALNAFAQTAPERASSLQTRLAEIARNEARVRSLARTQPEEYARALETTVRDLRALQAQYGDLPQAERLPAEIAEKALRLGTFVRFRLRDPRRAVRIYASVAEERTSKALLAIADTQWFDLKDGKAAQEAYRRMEQRFAGLDPQQDFMGLGLALREFLRHQHAFLARGQRFSGAIDPRFASPLAYFRFASYDDYAEPRPDPEKGAAALRDWLERLPPSTTSLAHLVSLPLLDEVVADASWLARFIDRHDPAGHAGAALLAQLALAMAETPAGDAAYGILKARGIIMRTSAPRGGREPADTKD